MTELKTENGESIHKSSPMSPILKEMADYFLEIDATEDENGIPISYYIDYTDEDVMNAVHIFASVLWTKFNKSWNSSIAKAHIFWQTIHKFVLHHTGVDTMKAS